MEHLTGTYPPPAPPGTSPLRDRLPELLTDLDERGQVTVHCRIDAGPGDAVRIWTSTYLVCRHTGHRSRLLHAEGIPYAPLWMPLASGSSVQFTLLFEALPRECLLFDLVEEIPEEGGFFSPSILRNDMDVYRVDV